MIFSMFPSAVKSLLGVALLSVCLQAQDLAPRLDTLLAKYNEKNGPGMAAMLIRDGHIVYNKNFGPADLDSRTSIAPGTQFRLGSVTKQFTAYSIGPLHMVSAGSSRRLTARSKWSMAHSGRGIAAISCAFLRAASRQSSS
jgi:hypothetical protein